MQLKNRRIIPSELVCLLCICFFLFFFFSEWEVEEWGGGGGFGGWVDYQGMHPAFSGLHLQNWGYYMRRGISFPYIFPFPEGEFNNTK